MFVNICKIIDIFIFFVVLKYTQLPIFSVYIVCCIIDNFFRFILMVKRRIDTQGCELSLESRRQKTNEQKCKKRPATSKKNSMHKRKKPNLSNLFQNLNFENKKEVKKKVEKEAKTQVPNYKNNFEEHSINFRKFFISLHLFLLDADKSIMKKITNNWEELVQPIMTHLDSKSLTGIKNIANLKQWHYDLTLAEIAAKALLEQSASWQKQMCISREHVEKMLEILAC